MSEYQIQMLLGISALTMCFSVLQLLVTCFILSLLSEWKWERKKAANV